MKKNTWPDVFPGAIWYDKAEEKAVLDVVRTGSVFRYYGPTTPTKVSSLEAQARLFYGKKYALAVNSGTGALITAMLALGIGPGDEVIVPAFMWVATVGAAVQCNAIPVLCEVDESLTMDPIDLARKITARTRLIVPVHMAGAPCAMNRIMAIADKRKIPVLEDCAQCNGGSFKGRKIGSFGKIGMFSFQINKNATSGEGGLLVTDDAKLYLRMNAAHDIGVPWGAGEPVGKPTTMVWGQGRRMSELCGAAAGAQLKKLPAIVKHMRSSHDRISAALCSVPGLGFRRLNDAAGNTGAALVLLLPNAKKAAETVRRIGTSLPFCSRLTDYGMHIYYNIRHLATKVPLSPAGNPWSLPQNARSVYSYGKGVCPKSDALFDRAIAIAIPSKLTHAQENLMIKIIQKAVS